MALCRLPALKKLSLRYCNSLTLLPDAFGELESLEELYLDAMALEGFPEVLTRLPRVSRHPSQHRRRGQHLGRKV